MKKILLPLAALTLSTSLSLAGNWFGSGPWANGTYYPGQLDGRYFANVYNNLGGTFTRVSTTNTSFTTNEVVTTTSTNTGGLPVTNIVTSNTVTSTQVTNTTTLGSVVSGVIGFGIRDGAPAFQSAGNLAAGQGEATSASRSALQLLSVDQSLNNFVIYVNGDVFIGSTAANINPSSSTVSGVLANGAGRTLYQVITNRTTTPDGGGSSTVQVLNVPTATASGYFNANVNNNKATYTFNGSGTIAIASASGNISEVDGTHDFQLNGIKTSGNSASAFPAVETQ